MPNYKETLHHAKRFEHRTEVHIVILILVAVFGLLYFGKLTFLPFKFFTESDVLAIVTSLFVVAVFMERSVEAIHSNTRPQKNRTGAKNSADGSSER